MLKKVNITRKKFSKKREFTQKRTQKSDFTQKSAEKK